MHVEKYKRTPPNYRKPDCCATCRAFNEECEFYKFNESDPENSVCDDYRSES